MGLLTTKPRGSRAIALLSGIGIGAAVMYVLDPEGGRRRRALVRDKAVSLANKTGQVVGARSRDIGNRAKGVAAEVRSAVGKSAGGGTDGGEKGGNGSGAKSGIRSNDQDRRTGPADFQEDGGL